MILSEDDALVLDAQKNPEKKNAFLENNRLRILNLVRKITGQHITENDDEWSVALIAASQAIDEYNESRGYFWGFAAIVIKSRILDFQRRQSKHNAEVSVQPAAFDGEVNEDEDNFSEQYEVREAAVRITDFSLKEEIEAAGEEFASYGFSFFDLAECSPKSFLTRGGCARAIRAIFKPPPLTGELKRTGLLPTAEIIKRTGQSRKLLDRHRKYLIAATLILSGDYPGLKEYFHDMKPGELS